MSNADVLAAADEVKETLGNSGRILLRESGTEPLVRVMVEAQSQKTCEALADKVIAAIKKTGLSL